MFKKFLHTSLLLLLATSIAGAQVVFSSIEDAWRYADVHMCKYALCTCANLLIRWRVID